MIYHPKVLPVNPRIQYVADGERKAFPFPFVIFGESDLEIFQDDVIVRHGFSIRGIGDSVGGVVEFDSPPPAGAALTLRRNVQIQRTSDFQQSGILSANVLNSEFDQLTAAVQQVSADVNRAIRLAPTDADAALVLPTKAERAGRGLSFDTDGNLTTHPLATTGGGGAQGTLDSIPEGVANKHFSAGEKSKLATIEMGAQSNPPAVTGTEKIEAGATQARSFTPRDIADMVSLHGAQAGVASVFGRNGAVVAENGDYSAGQIANTPSGSIAATNVQAAINELDNEKAPIGRKIIAGAGLTGGGDLTADRTLAVAFAGTGVANSAARSDHAHDALYARQSRLIAAVGSLTGGGDLTGDRSLSLVNDAATPGGGRYYGTDATGAKGWFALPTGAGGGIDGTDDVFIRPYDRVVLASHLANGPYTPSWTDGPYLVLALSANITSLNRPPAIVGAPANTLATMTMELTQDATGGRTVAINTNPASGGFSLVGGAPVVETQPGRSTSLTFYTRDGGATWILLGLTQANEVGFAPSGTLTANTVQAALVEVDNKKAAVVRKVTAGAGLQGGGDFTADRTLAVNFGGSGVANTAARSDHGHAGLVPTGGTTGQVLAKSANGDLALAWVTPTAAAAAAPLLEAAPLATWSDDNANKTLIDWTIPGGLLTADGQGIVGEVYLKFLNSTGSTQYLGGTFKLADTTSIDDSIAHGFGASANPRVAVLRFDVRRVSSSSGLVIATTIITAPGLAAGAIAAGDWQGGSIGAILGETVTGCDWAAGVRLQVLARMTNAHANYSLTHVCHRVTR